MLRSFVIILAAICFGMTGCTGGGAGGNTSTTSTDGKPTTAANVRTDYKKAGLGQRQNQPFTTEQEAVKTLPAGYPVPGEQQRSMP